MGRGLNIGVLAARVLAAWAVLAGVGAAHAVRFGGDAASTRVVIDLGATTPGKILVREEGPRLTVEIPCNAPAAADAGRGSGLVSGWTLAADGADARVTLDLAAAATVRRRFLIPPTAASPRWRYVLDLGASDLLAGLADSLAATPPSATASPATAPPAGPLTPTKPKSHTRSVLAVDAAPKVIVIDPGHGGHDTGAQGPSSNEKDINLAAALALKARLERSGRYRVVLTRGDDTFIPLPQRVRIARQAHADLFISLHSDSAGKDSAPHGASVYTVNDHGVTRVKEVMGPHDLFTRVGDRRADPGVGQILLDLSQRSTRNRSAQFAGLLIDHIGQSVDVLSRGHRDASYYVLLAPDVPAVLLEMGFITNPDDQARLTDPDQRRDLMDKVADAIDAYFTPRRELALR